MHPSGTCYSIVSPGAQNSTLMLESMSEANSFGVPFNGGNVPK
jgi:hypothetical protein